MDPIAVDECEHAYADVTARPAGRVDRAVRGQGGYQTYEMWGHAGAGGGESIRGILKKPGHEESDQRQQWWICLGLAALGITIIAVLMVAILGMVVILLRG